MIKNTNRYLFQARQIIKTEKKLDSPTSTPTSLDQILAQTKLKKIIHSSLVNVCSIKLYFKLLI